MRQRHVVRPETRPANIEGKGAVRQRDSWSTRSACDRPHHRRRDSDEALDMLQAMNTGTMAVLRRFTQTARETRSIA
jgi:pilus assembly protein CpaF